MTMLELSDQMLFGIHNLLLIDLSSNDIHVIIVIIMGVFCLVFSLLKNS